MESGRGNPSGEGLSPTPPRTCQYGWLPHPPAQTFKKVYGGTDAAGGYPAAPVPRFLPREKPCRSMGAAPENRAFENPLAGHSQDTKKSLWKLQRLFLFSSDKRLSKDDRNPALPRFRFPIQRDSSRDASPPVEVFAGGGTGEGAFFKKRPPPIRLSIHYSHWRGLP